MSNLVHHHEKTIFGMMSLPIIPSSSGGGGSSNQVQLRFLSYLLIAFVSGCVVTRTLYLLPTSSSSPSSLRLSSASSFSSSSNAVVNDDGSTMMIKFEGFNEDLIPSNTLVDVNIGTNYSPFAPLDNRHRILVDPLFEVCESNAKLSGASSSGVTAFCFAISNYTGFASFHEYNYQGKSSSLSNVAAGTNHERFEVLSKRTVLVLEAMVLFGAIRNANSRIYRLKLDMQGNDLTTLTNIQSVLHNTNDNHNGGRGSSKNGNSEDFFILHIMAECFCPKQNGLQIYQIDNACEKSSALLQNAGYETKWHECKGGMTMTDLFAFKKGVEGITDFLPVEAFN